MTVGLYQSGVSGLLAAQQQLATTGHNISNVNTEGYTRQRADQGASLGLNNSNNYIGSGTYIQDITRLYDQFSYKEQLINQSNLGNADFLQASLSQLDQIMSTSGESLVGSMAQFYQGINSIADNPNDLGLRSIVLNQAGILSTDFNQLNDNFEQMDKSVNGEIEQIAVKISNISQEIAQINESILSSQRVGDSGQPNDLLDKRDRLINELGKYTSVTTVEDKNKVMTVMIGQGTTLVAGITPLTLEVTAGNPDPKKTELRLVSSGGNVAINGAKLGGALAANFEFRDVHLKEVGNEIDRLAMAISSTLNESQNSGLDLNSLQGRNLFTDINSIQLQQGRVLAPTSNAGSLQAQVNISDVSLLPTDDFEIKFDGTDFIMTNLTDRSTTNLGTPGSGTPAGTHSTAFGFEFIEAGAPSNGDIFIIEPTNNSAALMEATLTEPNGIAASASVEISPSSTNVSDGKVNIINVTDPVAARNFTSVANQGLLVDVYESAPGTFSYRVYDADPLTPPPTPPSLVGSITSGTFTTGNSVIIDMPPAPATTTFQFEISGQPSGQGVLAPEKFNIKDAFGLGNGNNAVAMAKTQEQGVLNGSKETFSQSLGTSTAVVGSKASNASFSADTAQALYTQAYNRNQETSGVNLDEEAANLMKFQQAYQAASQIISVANTLFDTILAAVR
jgi:flagellar hook-associated protein 1 FlgK